MIYIYTKSDTLRAELHQSSDSQVVQQISDEEYVTLKFHLNEFIDFSVGDYVTLYENKYKILKKPATVTKNSSQNFEYNLKFESARAECDNVNFQLFDDTTLLTIDEYDSATLYVYGAVVSYNGSIWKFIYDVAQDGQTPAEGLYWTEVLAYSAATTYSEGDYVYDPDNTNVVYQALQETTGDDLEEGDNWTVVNTAPEFDFSTQLSPYNYCKLIVNNMNRARPSETWVVGYCLTGTPQEASFSNVSCLSALGTIADLFETEFYVDTDDSGNNQINIGKRTYQPESGLLTFRYGKGNGLTNIKRTEVSNSKKVTRLTCLGGTKNLYSTYRSGSDRLMLPDRYYLDADNVDEDNPLEDVVTYDDIYPCLSHATEDYNSETTYNTGDQVVYDDYSWDCLQDDTTGVTPESGDYWEVSEGTVGSFVTSYKFIDPNLSFNPMDSDYIMSDGTTPKVRFITGNLAGYEFPISQYRESTHQITIEQIEDATDSYLPTTGYTFSEGDQYVLVDLYMPKSYVDKAEQRLLAKAQDYLDDYSQDQVTYTCTVDTILMTNNETELHIGELVNLIDTDLGIDAEYRIKTLKRNITYPYKYDVELSDLPYIPSRITSIENSIESNSTYLSASGLNNAMAKVKTFRGAQEALDMAFDPSGDYFSEVIKPLIVETSAVLVGTNEQQYDLVGVEFSTLSDNPDYIAWTAGSITDSTQEETARTWTIAASSFTATDGDDVAYYCYIKCPIDVTGTVGEITFTETQYETLGTDYYWFLIGTLGVLSDNMRQFYTSYGYTFINGNSIVTGSIANSQGTIELDLANEYFHIGTDDDSVYLDIDVPNALMTANNMTIQASSIESSSITASTFQTAETGKRVVVSADDNNINLYDSSENIVATFDDDVDSDQTGTALGGMKCVNPTTSKVTYVTANGVFNNAGLLNFLPLSLGTTTNANIVGLLTNRNTTITADGISAAIVGVDQTDDDDGNSTSYAGYFIGDVNIIGLSKIRGLAPVQTFVDSSDDVSTNYFITITKNTSGNNITLTLPSDPPDNFMHVIKRCGLGGVSVIVGDSSHYMSTGNTSDNLVQTLAINDHAQLTFYWDVDDSTWWVSWSRAFS